MKTRIAAILFVLAFVLLPFCAKPSDEVEKERVCQVVGSVSFKLCAVASIPDYQAGAVTKGFAANTCGYAADWAYQTCKKSVEEKSKYDKLPPCVGSRAFVYDSVTNGATRSLAEEPKHTRAASAKHAEKWAEAAANQMLYLCQDAKSKEKAPVPPAAVKHEDGTVDL